MHLSIRRPECRIGNAEIDNIVGLLENQLTNTSGLKRRDFATYYNMEIMISFYKHKKYAYKHVTSSQFQNSYIASSRLSELYIAVWVYRGSGFGSDHFVTLDKLRFLPKWVHLPKNTTWKENILHYKVRLLNGESIRWPDEQIIRQKLKEIPENSSVVLEWKNIKQWSHREQTKVRENTKYLCKKKLLTWDDAVN